MDSAFFKIFISCQWQDSVEYLAVVELPLYPDYLLPGNNRLATLGLVPSLFALVADILLLLLRAHEILLQFTSLFLRVVNIFVCTYFRNILGPPLFRLCSFPFRGIRFEADVR